MVVTPADHLILDEGEFLKAIAESIDFARANNVMMTIGIEPTRPDTGYGYIQIEERKGIVKVKTFTEKPSEELARAFVESGEFFWNSGIFIWKTSAILDAISSHLEDMYELFASYDGSFGTPAEKEAIESIYPACRSVSIDYGVIEKASNVYVRCSSFGWSDVGTWNSLYQNLSKDEAGNAAPLDSLFGDVKGSIVKLPECKLAVIDGLEDYIVVDTDDVLLIWPRGREQEIKQVTMQLKFNGKEKFL
jgi:mannose-1-phosphate guanylyltransferase